MIEIKVKYTPENVYNYMKETFVKNWKPKHFLGLYSSEDTPNFTNHEISESKTRCNICIRKLWHEMSKKSSY